MWRCLLEHRDPTHCSRSHRQEKPFPAADLIERAADVQLKEAQPLVIAPREMPWNLIHLRNLTQLAEAGARIAPPVPAWYGQPQSLDDMVDFMVQRTLDLFGYDLAPLRRWQGAVEGAQKLS